MRLTLTMLLISASGAFAIPASANQWVTGDIKTISELTAYTSSELSG